MAQTVFGQSSAFSAVRLLAALLLPAPPAMRRKFPADPLLAAGIVVPALPYLLSFAAGAMLYVVAEELLPRAGGRRGTCGFLVGFLLMMILDVALG